MSSSKGSSVNSSYSSINRLRRGEDFFEGFLTGFFSIFFAGAGLEGDSDDIKCTS